MKKAGLGDKILLIGAAAVLLCGTLGLCAFPAPRFSTMENRNLTAFPTFTLQALTNGGYTAALDDTVLPEPQAAFIARVKDGTHVTVEGAKHEIYRSPDAVVFPWWHDVLGFLAGKDT